MSQVIRPRIPYQGPIYEGIHEGKKIKIKGQVPYGADRFTVNLMTRLDSDCSRPLHLSIRFKMNTVVRNTYQNNWGPEETSGPFPFATGRDFTMMIEVERAAYQIYVNGQYCWSYMHRLPFTQVRSVLIDGDVSIDQIEFINSYTHTPQVVCPPSAPHSISNGPIVPCTFPLHGGIRPGMSINITGRPTSNPNKFTFNIQNGNSSYPPPDIAFHFDVRFYNYTVVRNSRVNDVWHTEETMISHFPFQAGCNFDVVIQIQSDIYLVMVNGQHFVTFRHRLNALPNFNVLTVEKDVIVTSIRYN